MCVCVCVNYVPAFDGMCLACPGEIPYGLGKWRGHLFVLCVWVVVCWELRQISATTPSTAWGDETDSPLTKSLHSDDDDDEWVQLLKRLFIWSVWAIHELPLLWMRRRAKNFCPTPCEDGGKKIGDVWWITIKLQKNIFYQKNWIKLGQKKHLSNRPFHLPADLAGKKFQSIFWRNFGQKNWFPIFRSKDFSFNLWQLIAFPTFVSLFLRIVVMNRKLTHKVSKELTIAGQKLVPWKVMKALEINLYKPYISLVEKCGLERGIQGATWARVRPPTLPGFSSPHSHLNQRIKRILRDDELVAYKIYQNSWTCPLFSWLSPSLWKILRLNPSSKWFQFTHTRMMMMTTQFFECPHSHPFSFSKVNSYPLKGGRHLLKEEKASAQETCTHTPVYLCRTSIWALDFFAKREGESSPHPFCCVRFQITTIVFLGVCVCEWHIGSSSPSFLFSQLSLSYLSQTRFASLCLNAPTGFKLSLTHPVES